MTDYLSILLVYFGIVSVITAAVTCLDKIFAKRSMTRVSEKALLLLALFGGSPAEYLTMRLIRHKTLHKKFMVGLPAMMFLQLSAFFIFMYLNNR